jgi:hypothetical protein
MARQPKTPDDTGEVKVRLLRDCAHGKCNEVVTMSAEQAASLEGSVDPDPEAVAYAESLVTAP